MATSTTQHMLTTTDNPFNPFTQFNEWNAWDMAAGYYTLGLLARVVTTSHDLTEPQQAQAILDGMKEVVEYNVSGVHKIVEAEQKFVTISE